MKNQPQEIHATEIRLTSKNKWIIRPISNTLEFSKTGSEDRLIVSQDQIKTCLRFRRDDEGYHVIIKQGGRKVNLTLTSADIPTLHAWIPKEIMQQITSKSLVAHVQAIIAIAIPLTFFVGAGVAFVTGQGIQGILESSAQPQVWAISIGLAVIFTLLANLLHIKPQKLQTVEEKQGKTEKAIGNDKQLSEEDFSQRNQEHVPTSHSASREQSYSQGGTSHITVVQRYTDLEENANVVDNQDIDNDTLPILVRRSGDTPENPESIQVFSCAWCNKLYKVNTKGRNLIFRCVKCKKQMLVQIK